MPLRVHTTRKPTSYLSAPNIGSMGPPYRHRTTALHATGAKRHFWASDWHARPAAPQGSVNSVAAAIEAIHFDKPGL